MITFGVISSCEACYCDYPEWRDSCETCGVLGREHTMHHTSMIPAEVWDHLRSEIAKHGLENADNFRACKPYAGKDWLGFVSDIEHAERRGCCGVFYSTIVDNDGERWRVACNYGH